MSQLISISISAESLESAPKNVAKNGKTYYGLTLSVNDSADKYGKNVSVYSEQSKEEREKKTPRHFVGQGKVIWGHGKIDNASSGATNKADDLPW